MKCTGVPGEQHTNIIALNVDFFEMGRKANAYCMEKAGTGRGDSSLVNISISKTICRRDR